MFFGSLCPKAIFAEELRLVNMHFGKLQLVVYLYSLLIRNWAFSFRKWQTQRHEC